MCSLCNIGRAIYIQYNYARRTSASSEHTHICRHVAPRAHVLHTHQRYDVPYGRYYHACYIYTASQPQHYSLTYIACIPLIPQLLHILLHLSALIYIYIYIYIYIIFSFNTYMSFTTSIILYYTLHVFNIILSTPPHNCCFLYRPSRIIIYALSNIGII